jgi:Transcription antiterminator
MNHLRGEIPTDLNEAWHVIRTTAGQEHKVSLLLRDQGMPTFCPMQSLISLVRGKLREQYRALFLTYVFGYWQADDAHQWHVIMNTPGVIEILGGSEPTPVAPGVVESWIKRADDKDIIKDLVKSLADLRRGYRLDDEVRITRGGHNVLTGVAVWIDDTRQQVGVKVSMLGRTFVIVRCTTDCELAALAPALLLRRRVHLRGGRRGHRARVKAFAQHLRKTLPP